MEAEGKVPKLKCTVVKRDSLSAPPHDVETKTNNNAAVSHKHSETRPCPRTSCGQVSGQELRIRTDQQLVSHCGDQVSFSISAARLDCLLLIKTASLPSLIFLNNTWRERRRRAATAATAAWIHCLVF